MAESRHYTRPPIAEAVLELRFDDLLSSRDLERLRDRFKSTYATIEQIQEIDVLFEGSQVQPKVREAGFKMTDRNAVDVIMVRPISFGTIRLAPYENWEQLSGRAKENWDLFTKVVGRKKVNRIGTRFINRIDIPNQLLSGRNVPDLFRTIVKVAPEIGSAVFNFAFSVNMIHKATGAILTIQSTIVQPPALLEHTSVAFDTDAFWEGEMPLRVDEMWAKADILRDVKNDVFENSISDKLRELFQ
jgi:uncharacterized protein (TIGR04255 family)